MKFGVRKRKKGWVHSPSPVPRSESALDFANIFTGPQALLFGSVKPSFAETTFRQAIRHMSESQSAENLLATRSPAVGMLMAGLSAG